jgi:ribosome-associated protein YbcJ (S4-like RNA binding protein)
MLDEDEITAAENVFMQGSEMKSEKRKGEKITYDDTVCIE